MKCFVIAVLVSLVFGTSSACAQNAQVRATVSDIRTVSVLPDGKVDTLLVHSIASGSKARMDYTGGFPAGASTKLRMTGLIMSYGDSVSTMTYIDSTRKFYAEMNTSAMMSMATAAVQMKTSMTSTDDSATLDSIGIGPIINGHKTVHFRSRSSSKLAMVIMGDSSSRTITILSDLFLAPDVKADTDSSDGPTASMAIRGVRQMIPPGMSSAMSRAERNNAILARHGMALRTITEITEVSATGTFVRRSTTDILRHEHTMVSASVFSPPAGYRKVSLMDLVEMP